MNYYVPQKCPGMLMEQAKRFWQELGKCCCSCEVGGKALTIQGQKSLLWTADVTVLSQVVMDPPRKWADSSPMEKEN